MQSSLGGTTSLHSKEINISKIKKVVNNKYQLVRDYSNLSEGNPLY